MPEQLTKHPAITLDVLKSAGAQCGEGAPQAILTRCPAERFCKLPGGELCVYGLEEAPRMTQISAADWSAVRQTLQIDRPEALGADASALLPGAIGVLVGLALGIASMRLAARRSRHR